MGLSRVCTLVGHMLFGPLRAGELGIKTLDARVPVKAAAKGTLGAYAACITYYVCKGNCIASGEFR